MEVEGQNSRRICDVATRSDRKWNLQSFSIASEKTVNSLSLNHFPRRLFSVFFVFLSAYTSYLISAVFFTPDRLITHPDIFHRPVPPSGLRLQALFEV